MEDFLLTHEPAVRFGVFAGLLAAFSFLEALFPARARTAPRARRWPVHAALAAVDTLALRLMGPVLAVGAAVYAAGQGIGLLNWTGLEGAAAWIVALLALDAAIWLQHLAAHKFPVLWRFHRIHHADTDVDSTTALRFHPVEIVLSMVYKVAVVTALGAPAGAVILFEIGLNGMAMFNHANLSMPAPLERALRAAVVTPAMHRIHHSTSRAEHDSNYGFNLSVWDRLFGTYTRQAKGGPDGLTIGLSELPDPAGATRLDFVFAAPFRPMPTRTPAAQGDAAP